MFDYERSGRASILGLANCAVSPMSRLSPGLDGCATSFTRHAPPHFLRGAHLRVFVLALTRRGVRSLSARARVLRT